MPVSTVLRSGSAMMSPICCKTIILLIRKLRPQIIFRNDPVDKPESDFVRCIQSNIELRS